MASQHLTLQQHGSCQLQLRINGSGYGPCQDPIRSFYIDRHKTCGSAGDNYHFVFSNPPLVCLLLHNSHVLSRIYKIYILLHKYQFDIRRLKNIRLPTPSFFSYTVCKDVRAGPSMFYKNHREHFLFPTAKHWMRQLAPKFFLFSPRFLLLFIENKNITKCTRDILSSWRIKCLATNYDH